ncbi:hypothetical protein TM49_04670 [Martelella endophytica]|uniref:Uncharacterized protein n=1 Tax=Martelella endophytica TaxID=1486262 RepID=A0A0D5LPA0_MAREN|nr:hypothetical protein TM49_04670 [Martelella endophytica]
MLSAGRRNLFAVQRFRNLLRRDTIRIVSENTSDNGRFTLVDRAFSMDGFARLIAFGNNIISIGLAAGGLASRCPAAKPFACLFAEILEVERIHRAFQADMHLIDAAFRDRLDHDAGKLKFLIEACDVGLIA